MNTFLVALFAIAIFATVGDSCVDSCMAYGITVTNISPYNKYNFFYLPMLSNLNDCKQCYFSVSVPSSNMIYIGLYNPNTTSNGITTATSSDLQLNTGFTTCDPGYCMVILRSVGIFSSISIQMMISKPLTPDCIYNNTHCTSSGIISSEVRYSTANPSYNMMGCHL